MYRTSLITTMLLSVLCCLALFSCQSNDNHNDELPIKIAFNVVFPNISVYDEVMTKASNEENMTYGILIHRYNENIASYEPYAEGVFDDISKATIDLYRSKKYNIKIVALRDFINQGNFFMDANGVLKSVSNSFIMNKNVALCMWRTINIWSDGYYGEIEDYTPTDAQSCAVRLENKTSGIKVSVSGLNKGTLIISSSEKYFADYSVELSEGTITSSSYLTFGEWFGKSRNRNDCSINLILKYKDENDGVRTLHDDNYTFTIGKRKIFDISLSDGKSSPINSGFDVSFDEVSLIDDEEEVKLDLSI